MDIVCDLLRQKASMHPENDVLSSAITSLDELVHTDDRAAVAYRTATLLAKLEAQGLWGTTEDERELRKAIDAELHSNTNADRFTIVTRPPSASSLPWTTDSGHALIVDPELAEQLNEVTFLHVLANTPTKVIPPGKSLRATLASPEAARALGSGSRTDRISDHSNEAGSEPPTLHAKVEEIAQRAFWDEVPTHFSLPRRVTLTLTLSL
ncbi:hypothetical protein EW145_g6287, partial [Phellinidium pouzarii]